MPRLLPILPLALAPLVASAHAAPLVTLETMRRVVPALADCTDRLPDISDSFAAYIHEDGTSL